MHLSKRIAFSILVIIGIGFAAQGIAQDIKFNAIKPTASSANLTDEQQGILAVRKAKASVVDIIGTASASSTSASAATSPSIEAIPNESVAGTGFIIDSSGLIVTNNHVIDSPGLSYSVILADGTTYPATIMGTDKFDDIALIKINATGLTAATLGNSDNLETGQTVFAIGNALGQYQDTVTRGVVSGLSRAVNETGDSTAPTTHNWIQTDAAINLGNSGGPLIDLDGDVIGMDTLIDSEGNSLGFAIPINAIKDAISQLKTFGTVSRPYLGVEFENIDQELQQQNNLPVSNGALIETVIGGSPADLAGLQPNDIITAVNNIKLNQTSQLDQVIQTYEAGSQVTLKVSRNGQTLDLPVVLGELK
jgi:serine protease Do